MKVIRQVPTQAMLVLALLLVLRPAAAAEPIALRQDFLDCERQAASTLLDFADASRCSLVYEQLLKREFQGDFAKLLAWWQAQRRAAAPSSPQT